MARDKADVWAEALVASLLESGGLELVSRSSRLGLESLIAAHLARGTVRAPALADAIMRFAGVSELHVEDDALAETLRRTQPTNAEVAVSDAAALAIQAAMTKPAAPAPPPPSPLDKLAPDARAVVDAAKERARRAGHLQTTLEHVLVEMLALPKTFELAKRRGGRPEEAKAEAETRLGRLKSGSPVAPTPPLEPALHRVLEDAEELAPRLVSLGDLALAAMQPERDPHPLFVEAFAHHREPSAKPKVTLEEVGPFTISKELTASLAYLFRQPEARLGAQRALGSATLTAYLVDETERELETSLPEDFWAAAAARLQELADLGIAATPNGHGEPAVREEIGEVVLTMMSAAESADLELEVDGAPLVAFIGIDRGNESEFLCVRRGVTRAARNRQPVFAVRESGTTEYESFGAWVLAVSREG